MKQTIATVCFFDDGEKEKRKSEGETKTNTANPNPYHKNANEANISLHKPTPGWFHLAGRLMVIAFVFFLCSNLVIMATEKKKMVADEALVAHQADCILILGAGVWEGGVPSPMLADRLDTGVRLYREEVAPKILVSGDHGQIRYDEVNAMKTYLMKKGIPSEDIFMDHAGFSTYESMYRAKAVFGVNKLIVVTQKYHMYRALYICDRLGLDAKGATADPRLYAGALYRNIREWIARDKDILTCFLQVKPTYLGEPIDIHGDGNVTNG